MNDLLVTMGEYGMVGYDERGGIWQEDAGTDSLVMVLASRTSDDSSH